MCKGGNFNAILNVASALRQEDEELYDICLRYSDNYSRGEILANLRKHGHDCGEMVGDGGSKETICVLVGIENDEDEDEDESEEEMIERLANENKVRVEIHTQDLDEPIKKYGSAKSKDVVRLYRDDEESEDGIPVYYPIVNMKTGKSRNRDKVDAPARGMRPQINVHTNPDIKVLWKISEADLSAKVCSCVIDCEVVKYDPMEIAIGIVERAKERVAGGGKLLPVIIKNKQKRNINDEQVYKDVMKLRYWKQTLKGHTKGKLDPDVKDYLDVQILGWREEPDSDQISMENAIQICKRANDRKQNGGKIIPRLLSKSKRITPELIQEYKDANMIGGWKLYLKGNKNGHYCPPTVSEYLNEHLPDWRKDRDNDEIAMEHAIQISQRAFERLNNGGTLLPKATSSKGSHSTKYTIQETKDANHLTRWRRECRNDVRDYLNKHLPRWSDTLDEKSMQRAKDIVDRANFRFQTGGKLLPRIIEKCTTNDDVVETQDAQKIRRWRVKCTNVKIVNYLDLNLPRWSDTLDEKSMQRAIDIVSRAKARFQIGGKLLPRKIQNKSNRTTPELECENKDAVTLGQWKATVLRGNKNARCPSDARDFLDANLEGWRDQLDLDSNAMKIANEIITRAKNRVSNGGYLLPKHLSGKEHRQEFQDSNKLSNWRLALEGSKNGRCSEEVRDLLDKELPGWRPIESSASQPPIPKKPKKKSMKLSAPSEAAKKETPEQKRQRVKSELSVLHQEYKTLKSKKLHKKFQDDPQLWTDYHDIAEANEESFPQEEIPRNRAIQYLAKIKTKRAKRVVDMGCGKAQIAAYFKDDTRFHFTNYDHVALNSTVESCDISNMPLEDDSVEICILSLAMWGSNCKEYIKEAYRVLESGGKLYIVEPTKRWSEKDENGNIIEGKEACKLKHKLEKYGFTIRSESIEKFCMFICEK